MAVALSPELPADAIEHLIVADIAPSSASLSTEFQGYIDAMNKIEQGNVNSRREAHDILSHYEPVRLQLAAPSRTLLREINTNSVSLLGSYDPRVSPN